MSVDVRTCTKCDTERPLADFAADARRKSGVRATCKPCDREERGGRRERKPLALVLAPKFPTPPPSTVSEGPASASSSGAASLTVQLGPTPQAPPAIGDYAAAVEVFIAALVPPAGPADAVHVRALRHLAELIDLRVHPAAIDAVRDATALVGKLVAVQAAIEKARAGAAKPEAPKSRLASGQF